MNNRKAYTGVQASEFKPCKGQCGCYTKDASGFCRFCKPKPKSESVKETKKAVGKKPGKIAIVLVFLIWVVMGAVLFPVFVLIALVDFVKAIWHCYGGLAGAFLDFVGGKIK